MRNYELVLIIRQNLTSSEVDKIISQVLDIGKENDFEVKKHEYWGLRPLAYPIAKNRKAHYVLLYLTGNPSNITEFERRLKLMQDLVRLMFLQVDKISEDPSPILHEKINAAKAVDTTNG